jgi:ubiquinone/menaquinone biosynthesis C-methylase UbiE
MNFYDRHILPRIIQCSCGAPMVMELRRAVVPEAQGEVLEIGCGGGLNFPLYRRGQVRRVTAIDPAAPMLERARRAVERSAVPVELAEAAAEALPFPAASFDSVVFTFTLCSVRDHAASLAEARRVLRPNGRLIFAEHGLAPEASVQRWQRRIEPVWSRLAGGCHLTRPVRAAIAPAGFELTSGGGRYLPAPKVFGWAEWGTARPA